MNNQSPSEVLGNLASIASLNPFSPFTMGLNDILDMIKTDKLSISTGDKPVTKEEVKEVMDKSDSITLGIECDQESLNATLCQARQSGKSLLVADSIARYVQRQIPGNHFKDRKVMTSGGLVKQILQRSRSNITILNALSYLGYNYSELKKHVRWRKMSLSEFMGTLSKPQLIEIYNYVDSHMASRGPK